jgi:two-component system, sporulation sensor kinase D
MNVYTKKLFWKYLLGGFGISIVIFSFWYTSSLAKEIEQEERLKIKIWAEAIQKKAVLVKYTAHLFEELAQEERKKVELWAEATKKLAADLPNQDYSFILKVVSNNTTVPVILTDEQENIISHRNIELGPNKNQDLRKQLANMKQQYQPIEIALYGGKKNYLYYQDSRLFAELKQNLDDIIQSFISEIVVNSASVPVIFVHAKNDKIISYGNFDKNLVSDSVYIHHELENMKKNGNFIPIEIDEDETRLVYYQDSELLKQLTYYPFIQFTIIGIFILIAYWLFSSTKKAEQNQVWVGLAKETAHQLGTPLSSLMAWVELLKTTPITPPLIEELNKDVRRLETITERFSKIGSEPTLTDINLYEEISTTIRYLQPRVSKNIKVSVETTNKNIIAKINTSLFSWVIENLFKNSVDAMEGKGEIKIEIIDFDKKVHIDISDNGKGISPSKVKTVFKPGYTTKQRGWGLGLSLAKRIIETYHHGKIFVKKSEINVGTTFRITLQK